MQINLQAINIETLRNKLRRILAVRLDNIGDVVMLHVPADIQARADGILEAAGVDPKKLFIVLAPGASCAARRYDAARYAVVARRLIAMTGLPLVVAGSEREAGTFEAPATNGQRD